MADFAVFFYTIKECSNVTGQDHEVHEGDFANSHHFFGNLAYNCVVSALENVSFRPSDVELIYFLYLVSVPFQALQFSSTGKNYTSSVVKNPYTQPV